MTQLLLSGALYPAQSLISFLSVQYVVWYQSFGVREFRVARLLGFYFGTLNVSLETTVSEGHRCRM